MKRHACYMYRRLSATLYKSTKASLVDASGLNQDMAYIKTFLSCQPILLESDLQTYHSTHKGQTKCGEHQRNWKLTTTFLPSRGSQPIFTRFVLSQLSFLLVTQRTNETSCLTRKYGIGCPQNRRGKSSLLTKTALCSPTRIRKPCSQ